jgi:hypothetical protein
MHPAMLRNCSKPRLFVWYGIWWCAADICGVRHTTAGADPESAYRLAMACAFSDALAGLRRVPARVC